MLGRRLKRPARDCSTKNVALEGIGGLRRPMYGKLALIRPFTFVAVAALGFVALPAGGARCAAAIPDGLYEALAQAPDIAGAVATCASQKHESKVAAARWAYAVSLVKLTRGVTIYRVDGADPCVGANQNGPLLAFVESGPGEFRQVLSTAATAPKSANFGPDGSLTVESRDSAASHDVITYHFDGSKYAEVRDELFDEATGEHKQVDVPIHFAYGTSSATVSGKVSGSFPDGYLVDASAGQAMSIAVHPTSGKISSVTIFEGAPGTGAVWSPQSLSWRGKLPKTGTYSILVEGGGEGDAPATYTMTVTIE
jgi:hypothetical protein